MPNNTGPGQERRVFKRLRVNLAILFRVDKTAKARMQIENQEIRATMIDLSEGGVSILSSHDIPEGSVLSLKFTLFKVDNEDVSFYGPMDIVGEVRYRHTLSNNEYRLGIVFRKVETQDRGEIASFIGNSA
ncbi:MAG TPA: PilZ domain-containing protein [Candidatus Omnitrophota bacterium]|nr:PilZ domain-containing protein [Candidatus Omnitrophota bacterium]HNQ50050.1 PilZ domain-containing protein [Candidatus Omnitrophota bacterium]HQO37291.1 PilZ domain-containing protein [Candidatus Omnitrophota bacterium]HQQ05811.1 PilZ domain-containing protein [Candidatus Omnitrophota bacterium]